MKVRLTTFSRSDGDLLRKMSIRYLGGQTKWRDIQFVTDETYDKLIIFTFPFKSTLVNGYNADKAITFRTEPTLSQFSKKHPTSSIMPIHLHLPFFPQDLKQKEVLESSKTKNISIIVSELRSLPGHLLRLKFTMMLDKVFSESLDIYGRILDGKILKKMNNYRGSLDDKFEGLWKYQYHFACENSFESGYFTEKLIDPILAETLCFYDGCPDITKYIDDRAFIKLDLNEPQPSIHRIIEAINTDEWKKRLPFLRSEKKRFLNDLHPFNLIWQAAHNKDLTKMY